MLTPNEERLLAALEAVTPEEPMNHEEMGGCIHCDGKPKRGLWATADPKHHSPDCAWLAARTLINELRS